MARRKGVSRWYRYVERKNMSKVKRLKRKSQRDFKRLFLEGALVFIAVIILVAELPSQARAEVYPFVDNFDTFNSVGWVASAGLYSQTASGCKTGLCVSGSGNKSMYLAAAGGTTVPGGVIWYSSGTASMDEYVQISAITASSGEGGAYYYNAFGGTYDGDLHQYSLFWEDNGSGALTFCFMEDDNNISDCSWSTGGYSYPTADGVNYLYIGSDSIQAVTLDDFGSGSYVAPGGCDGSNAAIYNVVPPDISTTSSPVIQSARVCVPSADVTGIYGARISVALWQIPIKPLTSPVYLQLYTASGTEYDFSTTTVLAQGNYQLQFNVLGTLFGVANPFSTLNYAAYSKFTVGSATSLRDVSLTDITGLSSSTLSTLNTDCNVFSGGSVSSCVVDLFVPDSSDLSSILQNNILPLASYPPIGYATQFWNDFEAGIASSTASSSLPSWNVTLPSGYPGAGTVVNLTPWNSLLGTTSMLSTARDPNTGMDLYDIVYPGWTDFVYFLAFLVIIGEVIGIGGKWITSSAL